ncbi:MAG TPA: sucrase ferredoxin [Pyrinomonadaceae bacterium]|jgi:hypothetical protein
MMSPDLFYCSEESRRHGEKRYGTASVGDTWLLVEYPHFWGPKAIHDSALLPAVKNHLSLILKTVPRTRVLFIKQDRRMTDAPSLFIVRCRERNPAIYRTKLESYGRLLDFDLPSLIAGAGWGDAKPFDGPLYLVCTHGRRDKCCAKFGYPIFKALRSERRNAVWQSSHVGGDRFAANLICFPHGLFHAHVTAESGRAIMDQYEAGRLVMQSYRGRSCYSYPVQAAEFFVRTESGINEIDALRYHDCARLDERTWRASFKTPADGRVYEAKIVRVMSEFLSHHTCHSSGEKSVAQYVLADYRETGREGEETGRL